MADATRVHIKVSPPITILPGRYKVMVIVVTAEPWENTVDRVEDIGEKRNKEMI